MLLCPYHRCGSHAIICLVSFLAIEDFTAIVDHVNHICIISFFGDTLTQTPLIVRVKPAIMGTVIVNVKHKLLSNWLCPTSCLS